MDPNATLVRLIDAATDGDIERMDVAFMHLRLWLDKGGFAPTLADVLAILTVRG